MSTCILTKDPECSLNLGETKDLSIPYICGQDSGCQVIGDKWAMERAMENVRKNDAATECLGDSVPSD